ncbi:MAG: hypothetical protein ACI9W2_002070 [Gammaproteobacteria bacterium]|jgi:hypothetical protein
MPWQPSPSGTVWRKRLHLSGPTEAGVVTSIVRYEPGASFHLHEHPDGEEIFVLEGTFSDEHRDSPAGTYLLNPEGFSHAPFSREGCVLFVKLRQFPGKRMHECVDTLGVNWVPGSVLSAAFDNAAGGDGAVGASEQARIKGLYDSVEFSDRTVIEKWPPGTRSSHAGAFELFVLSGTLNYEGHELNTWAWMRHPHGCAAQLHSRQGCEIFVKYEHL